MSYFQLLLLAATLLSTTAKSESTSSLRDNSQECTCYALDSDGEQSYFLYHKFYDFRNFAKSSNQYTTEPPLIDASQRFGKEPIPDQDVLNTSAWNSDWGVQDWGKKSSSEAPVAMQNSPGNVFVGRSNTSSYTHLTLRTTRLPTFQSISELENQQKNMLHASLRFRARVLGAPGAVAGLFTFVDDNNESDMEILTRDPPTTYRYTNQPATRKGDDVPAASKAPGNLPPWNEWRTHRIDWLKGMSRWFVDGKFVVQSTYSVPRKPSGLVLNMWGDGGVWSGNMSVGDSAELQIEWVQMLFNTSGKREGPKGKRWLGGLGDAVLERRGSKGCTTVCKVDGVEREGFPEVVYVSPNSAAVGRGGIVMSVLTIVLVVGIVNTLIRL